MAGRSKPPPWVELPREITSTILFKLGTIEILTVAQKVCRLWRSVVRHSSPSMWRKIDMGFIGRDPSPSIFRGIIGNLNALPCNFDLMCRDAVDRSQGQLIDIHIHYFSRTTHEHLLSYISLRCGQLKCLSISWCMHIGRKAVREAFENFPLLEELHLIYTPISDEDIKVVGRLCPRLKSFRMNVKWHKHPVEDQCDKEAIAIAESMPELRHLDLIGNKLTNEGLKVILVGCRHLESLDLRQCFNVDLRGELGTLCSQRVKNLRGPSDSLLGCKFNYKSLDRESSEDDYTESEGSSDVDMVSDYDDDLEFPGGNSDYEESSGDNDEDTSGDSDGYDPFYNF